MNDVLISRLEMECPLCDELHLVEVRERDAISIVKEERVCYRQKYYRCVNSDEGENDFIPSKVMDENLLAARNAYRHSHHMLTSDEIVALRRKYGLTQKEFAKMLGWGEATIARYETKLIQDETHDDILKKVRDDVLEAHNYLERNKDQFSVEQYNQILVMINQEIDASKVFHTKKRIEADYVRYRENLESTGGTQLDIDKVCNMIKFFANHSRELYKVKLMKLLWYSDALSFKRYHHSMSGLVYQHMTYGALPIGNEDFMKLVSVERIEDDINQTTSYKLIPSPELDENVFSQEEKEILYEVQKKFIGYTGKDIALYMHEEVAYTDTSRYEVIPYSLAGRIREF